MNARLSFDAELETLSDALIKMGAQATNAIEKAVEALVTANAEMAKNVIDGDRKIDEQERAIEHQCLTLLLRQQPVASDLRKISTAIKMITDIERIGDAAADIAEITLYGCGQKLPKFLPQIANMAATARQMVEDAIKAYVTENLTLAADVIVRDDLVDADFNNIKSALAASLADPQHDTDAVLDCLMMIKYIERMGDHAVNISEWVQFYKTGMHKNQRIL